MCWSVVPVRRSYHSFPPDLIRAPAGEFELSDPPCLLVSEAAEDSGSEGIHLRNCTSLQAKRPQSKQHFEFKIPSAMNTVCMGANRGTESRNENHIPHMLPCCFM
ncbi:hypothetical protein E1B28_012499 [Marasmius oreades]|uniref:Uncharacterized protein n=1 Tax=Marasmius oreades TaxID=181124 RepID=A0A9P7RRT2_9AGAR|nr:uncharacterized protein E1B28_012499 [Marasmius oreades]KAG7088515.1 hypothetical protein E1B28_012499 [Marasmius oreades]